jgi:hypothetical protein
MAAKNDAELSTVLENVEEPSDLDDLERFDEVDDVLAYQGQYADKSIVLAEHFIQTLRANYLRELRDDFEWVESNTTGQPFVLLKRRR